MSQIRIEKQFDVTLEEQSFLDYLMSNECPYFLEQAYPEKSSGYVWAHVLMRRNKEDKPVIGDINSQLYEYAYEMFKRFCDENNIEVHTVFRACINATGHESAKHAYIHIDHSKFEHHNFIMYLNDVGGSTYLFDDNGKAIEEIVPAKNKVAIFKGCNHAQGFCKEGEYRFVLVITFN